MRKRTESAMTKKELTVLAFKKLAEKYRNPYRQIFFTKEECPLCDIHRIGKFIVKCEGCPLATPEKRPGCVAFKTVKQLSAYIREDKSDVHSFFYDEELDCDTPYFEARAKFFELALPEIEGLHSRAFTQKGWKYEYFEFLRALDEALTVEKE
jgi:hypothetical protein